MVNGNVLERGKRDKLGHRGSKGLAGPQPAPLGYSPVMGGGGAAGHARGGSRGAAVPRELEHGAPSPTSFPVRLLPRGHVLGMAGTELGQVCTQFGVERLRARVPLEAF